MTMMMMMAMMVLVLVLAALRLLSAISRGKGATRDDLADRQTHIDIVMQHISPFYFLLFFYLACISTFWILFETLDCISRTSFTFLLLFEICT